MPELKTYTTPITTYDSFVDRAARDYIGDINRLDTADKSNLVNAINELIHFGNFVISVTGDVDSGYEIDKTGAEITTAIEKKVPIFLFALTDSVSAVLPVSSIEDGKIHFSGVSERDDRTLQNNVYVLYSDDSASVDYVSSTPIASKDEVDFALQEAERAQEMASEKVDKSGWTGNKLLGTDADGNVIETEAGDAVPVNIDLSNYKTQGIIVESFSEGTVATTTVTFDTEGRPSSITSPDGHYTTINW